MTQWCYGLKCLGLALCDTDDTIMWCDIKSSDTGIDTFSQQKVHAIAEMATCSYFLHLSGMITGIDTNQQ